MFKINIDNTFSRYYIINVIDKAAASRHRLPMLSRYKASAIILSRHYNITLSLLIAIRFIFHSRLTQ